MAVNIDEAPPEALSIHWSAVFAGVLISVLVYTICLSLGLAVGADVLREASQGQANLRGTLPPIGIWTVISVMIALFAGSYASGRVSGVIATRVGYTQGAVITVLFFGLLVSQAELALGAIGRGLTNFTAIAEGVVNPRVNAAVDDVIGGLELQPAEPAVVGGIVARLGRNEREQAVNFLAAHSKLSRADAATYIQRASERLAQLRVEFAQRASHTARVLGWSIFLTSVLGTIAALLGGATGAQVNLLKPVDKLDRRAFRRQRPAFT